MITTIRSTFKFAEWRQPYSLTVYLPSAAQPNWIQSSSFFWLSLAIQQSDLSIIAKARPPNSKFSAVIITGLSGTFLPIKYVNYVLYVESNGGCLYFDLNKTLSGINGLIITAQHKTLKNTSRCMSLVAVIAPLLLNIANIAVQSRILYMHFIYFRRCDKLMKTFFCDQTEYLDRPWGEYVTCLQRLKPARIY